MCSILHPSGYVRVMQLVCSILLHIGYVGAVHVLKIRNISNALLASLLVTVLSLHPAPPSERNTMMISL